MYAKSTEGGRWEKRASPAPSASRRGGQLVYEQALLRISASRSAQCFLGFRVLRRLEAARLSGFAVERVGCIRE